MNAMIQQKFANALKHGYFTLELINGRRVNIKAYRFLSDGKIEIFTATNHHYVIYRNLIRRTVPISGAII